MGISTYPFLQNTVISDILISNTVTFIKHDKTAMTDTFVKNAVIHILSVYNQ